MVALHPYVPPEFDYVATVPSGGRSTPGPWPGSRRDGGGREALLGPSPLVEVDDLVPGPDVPLNPRNRHRPRPGLQTRIRLSADGRTASVTVHRRLAECLRPGDRLHVARGQGGGPAVSVVRDGVLLAAVGDIAGLRIFGAGVSVEIPWDLVRQAQDVFHQQNGRFRLLIDPLPVVLKAGGRFAFSQLGVTWVEPYTLVVLDAPQVRNAMAGTLSAGCMTVFRSDLWAENMHLVSEELLKGMGPVELTRPEGS
jgi:hypothetical protein